MPVSVRYIVNDVDEAIAFHTDDLDAEIERLGDAGASFRGELVEGIGGNQILLEDPSGNPVELFEYPRS